MSQLKFAAMLVAMAVVLVIPPRPGYAQDQAAPLFAEVGISASGTFYAKRQRLDVLRREVDVAQAAYFDVSGRVKEFDSLDENEARARADLKEARDAKDLPRAQSIESYLRGLDATRRAKARDYDGLKKEVGPLKDALDAKIRERDALERELSEMIDLETPRQQFKLQMSLAFTLLVGIVIIGFFAIAARDETVRRQVFSGQSGLQFITLFSLIIAIILFGIVGILEAKELAALLGGLSGYILGRSTQDTKPAAAPPAEAPQGHGGAPEPAPAGA